ncbi:MAG: MarR family transcriptional regulator [Actinomycetota bacterium]|nr:MarR family transcriptional regulator [Actinomycetota bacterium]
MTRRGRVDETLLLDNQLCFLVYRLHRGITDLYRPVLAELGLTYPQYLVMLVLWESDPLTVGQVGGRLHLDSGTLSPLLKRLETAGLIARTRAASDERSVEVSLTAQGRALREQAATVPAAVGGCLSATADEYRQTRELFSDLLARVDAASR